MHHGSSLGNVSTPDFKVKEISNYHNAFITHDSSAPLADSIKLSDKLPQDPSYYLYLVWLPGIKTITLPVVVIALGLSILLLYYSYICLYESYVM